MLRPRTLAPLVAVCGPALALAALPLVAQPVKQFGEATTVVAVEVPVYVVDKQGRPVRGLTGDSFEVSDNGRKRELIDFEVVDLEALGTGGAAPQKAPFVPPSGRRHFLLLFDLAFSEPDAIVRARSAARGVLDHLSPSDLVAVSLYSDLQGAQMVLNFTSDRYQIEKAVETLGLAVAQRAVDPLNLTLVQVVDAAAASVDASGGSGGGKAGRGDRDQVFLENLQDIRQRAETAARQQEQGRVDALYRSLTSLAQMMAGLDGQKHLVYLSQGFNPGTLTGTTDIQRIQEMNQAVERGETWKVDSEERFGSSAVQNALTATLDGFRRAGCLIHSVDISGLDNGGAEVDVGRTRASTSFGSGRDGLLAMAKETGGEFYHNFNDLGVAMERMLESTSVTYVLTFQPNDLGEPGSYRRLKVKLRGAPKGTRLVHRPGYYAPRLYEALSPLERQLSAGDQILAGREGGTIGSAVMAAAFQHADGTAQVPVLVEVDGPSLLQGQGREQVLPLEIYAYALDAAGSVRDYLSQSVRLDLSKAGDLLRRSGLKYYGELELPAGEYGVRVLVRNATTGASSLRVAPVEVPPVTPSDPVLLGAFFPEPKDRWLALRDRQGEGPYPFAVGERVFIPAVRPLVERSGSVPVVLAVAGEMAGGALSSQVVASDGTEVGRGVLSLIGRLPSPAGCTYLLAALDAAALPPGEHTLVIELAREEGGEALRTTSPLVVTPEVRGVNAQLAADWQLAGAGT